LDSDKTPTAKTKTAVVAVCKLSNINKTKMKILLIKLNIKHGVEFFVVLR